MSRWTIPDTWVWARAVDIAEVVGGGTPATSDPDNFSLDGTPWLTPADLSGYERAYIARGARSLSPRGLQTSNARLLPAGSVLFSSRAPIGYVAIAANPLTTNQGFKSLMLGRGMDSRYVRYYLLASREYADSLASGSTFRELSAGRMSELLVPVAPSAEQRRIVAKLDALLSRTQSSSDALTGIPALLEKHRQSILAAAFRGDLTADWRQANPHLVQEWRLTPWSEVGRCQNGRAFPSSEYAPAGMRLLRPGNLHVSGRVEWTGANTRYMPSEWAKRFPSYVVGPGEIVMNLTAQSLKDEFLGRVCMTAAQDRCLLNQRIARLTPLGVDVRFAFWLFKSPMFRRYVDDLNTGSLIQHMFTSQVDEFQLPVPSREEQDEIARRIESMLGVWESVGATTTLAQGRIEPLERSILAKAFRGELVAQDPNDEPASVLLDRVRTERNKNGVATQSRAGRKVRS